jgi:hypothetical protein
MKNQQTNEDLTRDALTLPNNTYFTINLSAEVMNLEYSCNILKPEVFAELFHTYTKENDGEVPDYDWLMVLHWKGIVSVELDDYYWEDIVDEDCEVQENLMDIMDYQYEE